MDYKKTLAQVKNASRMLSSLSDDERANVLLTLADMLETDPGQLLAANAGDLERMDPADPLYDRLQLTEGRMSAIAADMRNVAALPCPLGEEIQRRRLPNGILLRQVRVPFGVVGVIYEARPNVTFDVFALCLKSGNCCVLKGGHDALRSNEAAISMIHSALKRHGLSTDIACLLPATHEATAQLLGAVGLVDVCIPRGGRRLIDFVRDNARVPVIETGAGVVSTYFDESGDTAIGAAVIENAKTRRVSVCNALDTLLIHVRRLSDLPALTMPLASKNVVIYADERARRALESTYPAELLREASDQDRDREWMDYKMGVFTVDSLDEAIAHISGHDSGHSECIVTEDAEAALRFEREVDAACVYVNVPTSFTDGAQFGLGAEIGISTQKLGPRGPMGLRELTSTRYLLSGHGQVRK
ncbi:MAG: glutamate-5-semialdehyde dehydrogenase [Bacteroides sp.]|nr:glutamate-5-semialdehyde dehydrogenase [Bacteroides sp.]